MEAMQPPHDEPPGASFNDKLVETVTLAFRQAEKQGASTVHAMQFMHGLTLGMTLASLINLVKEHPELENLALNLAKEFCERNFSMISKT